MQRLIEPDYEDGIATPRTSITGQELPSPREISVQTRFNEDRENPDFTTLLFAVGQFIDHDLTHVPFHSKFKSLF